MNGAQHYTEAEKLLTEAANTPACWDGTNPAATILLAEAQVHATLALAAAQADQVVADAHSRPNWVNTSGWELATQPVVPEGAPF